MSDGATMEHNPLRFSTELYERQIKPLKFKTLRLTWCLVTYSTKKASNNDAIVVPQIDPIYKICYVLITLLLMLVFHFPNPHHSPSWLISMHYLFLVQFL